MENNSVGCTSSSALQPAAPTEEQKELKKRGLRVDAEPFIPGEVTIRYPSSISPITRDPPPLSTLNSKYEQSPVLPTSAAGTNQKISPSKESDGFDNDVVLNKVAVPDNVASNENLLLDLLGEGDYSEDLDDYEDGEQQMRTAEGAYWGTVGPRIPTDCYTRQIGAASFLSTSFDNLTDLSEDVQPPSSIHSMVDLYQEFDDLDPTFTESLDSEQIEWVEEQLLAGNPKADGYFK